MDADGSKAIGVSELEDPLIALGFVKNRKEVQKLIDSVDESGNGEIEFDEFLLIMKAIKSSGEEEGGANSLYSFFQDMLEGNFSKRDDMDSDIPFMLSFSKYRRNKIIDAIILGDRVPEKEREDGKEDEADSKKLGIFYLKINFLFSSQNFERSKN